MEKNITFSDKIVTRDRIHLTENGEFVKTELETAETLNNFFGNVIKNLIIPKYSEYDPPVERVENRTIRAILKYRNHPSILAIRERKKAQISFCFKEVSIEEIQKEILPFINTNKRRILMKSFFRSQFNYCFLIRMCHSRTNNRKINRLYERCLIIIYNDKQSSFIKLLEKDNSVSIHQRNLQILAIEMFKVSNGLSPVLMNDIFKLRGEQTYNLRKLSQFYRPKVNSVYNSTESVSFLGPTKWDLVQNELKDIGNIAAFKKAITRWSPEKCSCRICKDYIKNVGFI